MQLKIRSMGSLGYEVIPKCWVILIVLISGFCTLTRVYAIECEYYNATECSGKSNSSLEGEDGFCAESQRQITCPNNTNSSTKQACFVVWQKAKNSSREFVKMKGCFEGNKDCVGTESCVDRDHVKQREIHKTKEQASTTHYCCCATDNCNRNYTWSPSPTTTTLKPAVIVGPQETNWWSVFAKMGGFLLLAVSVTANFLFFRRIFCRKPMPTSKSSLTDEENILLDKSESTHTLPVTLVEIKASGRFGSVWKASMVSHNNYVAVKILPLREKASWKLEQEVYSLPLMCDSEFILGYFGARHNCDGENMQLWLISEYIERGSLYDYLKGHVLTWNELLQVAITMCQGLAFLHEEIDAGVKGIKPAVAHRDFKSKNVLLRKDLTACVADFGLAHIFYPTKPVGTNHGQVGTRRYMAPEVLDGAVSFTRDNFQRIDMYACGLVLWELASRCCAQQGPVGEYRLPFDEHVGQQPTLEEMIEAVVSQRKRPTIRNDWMSHPGMAVLADAMKDAWDQDSEARISASCIVERLISVNNKII